MMMTALTYLLTIVVAVKFVTCDADDVAKKVGFRENHLFFEDIK